MGPRVFEVPRVRKKEGFAEERQYYGSIWIPNLFARHKKIKHRLERHNGIKTYINRCLNLDHDGWSDEGHFKDVLPETIVMLPGRKILRGRYHQQPAYIHAWRQRPILASSVTPSHYTVVSMLKQVHMPEHKHASALYHMHTHLHTSFRIDYCCS